jgi:hydrogenase expression/formation protein HypD
MRSRAADARQWLERLHKAAAAVGERQLAFMEVCGTHTVNAFRAGLPSLVPRNVRLLSGPGCPVCVTSQGDIDALVELTSRPGVTLCTYGDMLRVPGSRGSLELARGQRADVRVVYSAMDAVRLAAQDRRRQVVFAAVGFETTAPATAAAILAAEQGGLTNFTIFASHKLILPAMRALLDSGRVNVDGFLCPGHVSVVIGGDAFAPIVENYRLPCVIAGFEDVQIVAGLARLVELARDGRAVLENQYPQAVTGGGNRVAQTLLDRVFCASDVAWRALGQVRGSGLALRRRYALFDARIRHEVTVGEVPEPPGCRCGDVITGRATPGDCRLFGAACTPLLPIGPCMVSSEGTCQAWFKYHLARVERSRPAAAQLLAEGVQ